MISNTEFSCAAASEPQEPRRPEQTQTRRGSRRQLQRLVSFPPAPNAFSNLTTFTRPTLLLQLGAGLFNEGFSRCQLQQFVTARLLPEDSLLFIRVEHFVRLEKSPNRAARFWTSFSQSPIGRAFLVRQPILPAKCPHPWTFRSSIPQCLYSYCVQSCGLLFGAGPGE